MEIVINRVACIVLSEPSVRRTPKDRARLNRVHKLARKCGGWPLWTPNLTKARGMAIELWGFETHTALKLFAKESKALLKA